MTWTYSQYAPRLISDLGLRHKSGNEYGEQPCPNCGGVDRFWISEHLGELKHHCRQGCAFGERTSALASLGLLPTFDSPVVAYNTKKQLPILGEARLEKNKVVIPIRHVLTKEIVGKQIIYPDGSKKFEKGTKKNGAGAYIGKQSEKLYLCEGWATACAVHLSTNQQALFCLDAKALVTTSKLLNHQHIIIAADNDAEGIRAAIDTGLEYAFPEQEGSDWCDVYNCEGKEGVQKGLALVKEPKNDVALKNEHQVDGTLSFVCNQKGIIPDIHNYFVAIMTNDSWAGVLSYCQLTQTTMLTKPIPTSREPKSKFQPRPMRDSDITHARRWFASALGLYRAPKNDVAEAMLAAALENSIDPVRLYLEGLSWDGLKRIDKLLIDYAGAMDTDFNRKVGKLWMISAVARIYDPGCKADCALILESPQGIGKSTFLETLASKEWFHDGLPDLHSKDAAAGLRGKWIIELPELSAMRRSDVEAVKAFLSRTTERFRPAYARTEVIEPRRCVFAGTTNRSDYLVDDTGGRRFWPVPVSNINISNLQRDRDQLWAEAVFCFKQPEAKWWLDPSDEIVAANLIMQRATDDPWEAAVVNYIEKLSEVSTREILDSLGIPLSNQTKSDSMRVASIITRRSWVRDGKFTAGQSRGLTRYINPRREFYRLGNLPDNRLVKPT